MKHPWPRQQCAGKTHFDSFGFHGLLALKRIIYLQILSSCFIWQVYCKWITPSRPIKTSIINLPLGNIKFSAIKWGFSAFEIIFVTTCQALQTRQYFCLLGPELLRWEQISLHNVHIFLFKNIHRCHPDINPYRTAFPYGNGMVLHFYQQQESSTTKTVHKVINKGLKTYV